MLPADNGGMSGVDWGVGSALLAPHPPRALPVGGRETLRNVSEGTQAVFDTVESVKMRFGIQVKPWTLFFAAYVQSIWYR